MDSNIFSYNQLQRREIRLIKLLPISDSVGNVCCELRHVKLTSKPAYMALSYVWGDDRDKAHILIGGKRVTVPRNLYDFLHQIRSWLYAEREDDGKNMGCGRDLITAAQTTYLWADAVCINQADVVEKSLQVPRMKEIYSLAREVVAWIGPIPTKLAQTNVHGPEDMTPAKVTEQIFTEANSVRTSKSRGQVLQDSTKQKPSQIPFEHKDWFYQVFCDFIFRNTDLWNRIWVVQEMVLPKKSPVVVLGCHCARLFTLEQFYLNIERNVRNLRLIENRAAQQQFVIYRSLREWYNNRNKLWNRGHMECRVLPLLYREKRFAADLRWALGHLLWNFKATLPHDYVYGLLGMCSRPKQYKLSIPDYDMTFAEVFELYVRLIFRHTGDLSLLHTTNRDFRKRSASQYIPSWVPDLRFPVSPQPPSPQMTAKKVVFTDDESKMIVSGKALSTVICASEPQVTNRTSLETPFASKLQRDLNRFLDDFITPVTTMCDVTHEDALDQWLETATDSIIPTADIPHWRDWIMKFQSGEISVASLDQACALRNVDEESSRSYEKCAILLVMAGQMASFLCQDGVIRRAAGDHVKPRKGDILARLNGLDRCCLLRPAQNQGEYYFLGTCFTGESSAKSHQLRVYHVGRYLTITETPKGRQKFVLI